MGISERSFIWVTALLAAVAVVYWPTSASMVSVWSSSGTYSHGYFVAPAFLWLVWTRRHTLAALPIQPAWWALPLLIGLGLLWLVSDWMMLALPSQLAMVAMVPAVLASVLGIAWVRALLFPLAFLLFAVPFGESLVPLLMDWTADFTVAALRVSGVPVYRDGLHFMIPSGHWSVVDSCSGIRYLFACLAVSSLFAWTVFRSNTRRLLFIAFAAAVAVVANWVRAYAIVMLGHLSDNRIATGADHLVYGGVFFAVIMGIIFAAGAAWREDPPSSAGQRAPDASDDAAVARQPRTAALTLASVATLVVLLTAPSLSLRSAAPAEPTTALPGDIRPRAGWTPADSPVSTWRPVLHHPASVLSQSFARGSDRVDVHLGVFDRSTPQSKLTSALNRLVEPDGLNPHWKLAHQGTSRTDVAAQNVEVSTGQLRGREANLLVWHWYWVDGRVTSNALHAAALQLLARLRGRSEVAAWVTIHTIEADDPAVAQRVLADFAADMSAPIARSLWPQAQASMAGSTLH